MSTPDAPDWERVVVSVQAAGDVPDAPDWERIVVAPGGAPVGGGATSNWEPSDYGWAAWTFPVAATYVGGYTPGSGTVMFSQIKFAKAVTVSNSVINQPSQGNPAYVADENFVGIYQLQFANEQISSFDLLFSSAPGAMDQVLAELGAAYGGMASFAMGTSYTVPAGIWYYSAILLNFSSGSANFASLTTPEPPVNVSPGPSVPWPSGIAAPGYVSLGLYTALPASLSASQVYVAPNVIWQAYY